VYSKLGAGSCVRLDKYAIHLSLWCGATFEAVGKSMKWVTWRGRHEEMVSISDTVIMAVGYDYWVAQLLQVRFLDCED